MTEIIINGVVLTEALTMTFRVSLNHMMLDIQNDDELKELKDLYEQPILEIYKIIATPKDKNA